jgi:hypothetical protein
MQTVTRTLRIAASPLVLAVALGLLGTDVLGDDEDEVNLTGPSPAPADAPRDLDLSEHSSSR